MLSLTDIVTRSSPPIPWTEGDNIPWDDPQFSERMLAEHLSQQHDLASRRVERIDAQVSAIRTLIAPPPARVLDLACGPGLYLSRLAAAGYQGLGIDFAPASIDRAQSAAVGSEMEFRLDDLRTADFGTGYDAVLLLYGQLNVFRRIEARSIIDRAFAALRPGGMLIVEPQTQQHIAESAKSTASWSSQQSGLFSPEPHLLLTETFWDPTVRTSTERFYVIDAATATVTRHALSNEAYADEELTALLGDAGFENVELRPSLAGDQDPGLCVVIGVRTA